MKTFEKRKRDARTSCPCRDTVLVKLRLKRKVLFLRKWLAWRDTFEPRLEKLHDELRVAARRDEEG